MLIDRRQLLGLATLAALAGPARAWAPAALEIVPLWPDGPPEAGRFSRAETRDGLGAPQAVRGPRLVVYRPAHPSGTRPAVVDLGGTAVIVVGGGDGRMGAGAESEPACRWLQSQGITAFELIHRLPGDGWPAAAPFEDARRAMRIVRSRAAAEGFSRIGLIGFSSGAHLAGMTTVRPDEDLGSRLDAIDALSARPDFAALVYPVLSMMPTVDGTGARRALLGDNPGRRESEAFSVERHVDAGTPPVFLAHSADDPLAPIDHSLMMFNALRTTGIPAALHVFSQGGHGWGMGRAGTETAAWPGLLAAWLGEMAEGAPVHPPSLA
ncbi:alpha/beta hydrolase [Aureimonas glaciei]|uniref:Twin-arginine translocation pathway signal sequence domain protein n=1 Tax=Aureimonas glaciei TaxID=1776957 RepID=A0A917DHF9_9HYPH|nr:alpha/beta hydrolase [Aureimonas glaciei]GGD40811.1 twin-arginine translocation pathway signal sequence domain protein [Aureimonas glaciei]